MIQPKQHQKSAALVRGRAFHSIPYPSLDSELKSTVLGYLREGLMCFETDHNRSKQGDLAMVKKYFLQMFLDELPRGFGILAFDQTIRYRFAEPSDTRVDGICALKRGQALDKPAQLGEAVVDTFGVFKDLVNTVFDRPESASSSGGTVEIKQQMNAPVPTKANQPSIGNQQSAPQQSREPQIAPPPPRPNQCSASCSY